MTSIKGDAKDANRFKQPAFGTESAPKVALPDPKTPHSQTVTYTPDFRHGMAKIEDAHAAAGGATGAAASTAGAKGAAAAVPKGPCAAKCALSSLKNHKTEVAVGAGIAVLLLMGGASLYHKWKYGSFIPEGLVPSAVTDFIEKCKDKCKSTFCVADGSASCQCSGDARGSKTERKSKCGSKKPSVDTSREASGSNAEGRRSHHPSMDGEDGAQRKGSGPAGLERGQIEWLKAVQRKYNIKDRNEALQVIINWAIARSDLADKIFADHSEPAGHQQQKSTHALHGKLSPKSRSIVPKDYQVQEEWLESMSKKYELSDSSHSLRLLIDYCRVMKSDEIDAVFQQIQE